MKQFPADRNIPASDSLRPIEMTEAGMKIAIITGGSRGIGKAAARECARRGMGVIATYNSHKPGADGMVQEIESQGGKAVALALDVADTASFPQFAGQVARILETTWGRTSFDHLVNNAGFGLFNPIATVSEAEFDGLMNVHLRGPFFLTQTLLPLIADGGSILNRQADLGQNQFYNSQIQKVCAALGPVCDLLKGLGSSDDFRPLFGIPR